MADNSDKTLQTYIETVLKLQQERDRSSFSDDELRQIALDAGMSESDLAYMQKRFDDCLNRGRGFIRYQNWDGAIEQLEQAIAMAPNSIPALYSLAIAHWNREDRHDLDRAKLYAERCLDIDSLNDPALRLLSDLQKGVRPASQRSLPKQDSVPSGNRRIAIIGTVIGIICVVVIVLVIGLNVSGPTSVPKSLPKPVAVPSIPHPNDEIVPLPPSPPDRLADVALVFGSEGIGPGMFKDARSIAVDGAGNIYVGEYQGGRIQAFDPAGKFITQWSIGPKSLLRGMSADRKGTVYTVYGGEIYRYQGATGTLLGKVNYKGRGFDDVIATADGGLVASYDGLGSGIFINAKPADNIIRFDASGKVVKTIEAAVSTAADESELNTRVAADGLGNIYALGIFTTSVFKFTPAGKFVNRFGGRGNQPGQLSSPYAIAVDGQGRIYVADGREIKVFDGSGRYIDAITVDGAASGIAFNDRDEMFVVARTKVVKYIVKN